MATTPTIPTVDEATPAARYAIRANGKQFLGTPAGGQDLHFDSTTIADAVKFATVEDAQRVIKHLFDIEPPTVFDQKTDSKVPDPDAPAHIGRFHPSAQAARGVAPSQVIQKSTLEIVKTHT